MLPLIRQPSGLKYEGENQHHGDLNAQSHSYGCQEGTPRNRGLVVEEKHRGDRENGPGNREYRSKNPKPTGSLQHHDEDEDDENGDVEEDRHHNENADGEVVLPADGNFATGVEDVSATGPFRNGQRNYQEDRCNANSNDAYERMHVRSPPK